MKKLYYLIAVITGLFIIYLFFILSPKNYTFRYKIKDVTIEEKFSKKDNIYTIKFDNNYVFSFENKYTRHRGIVNKISKKDGCITFSTDFFNDLSLCKNDNITYIKNYDFLIGNLKGIKKDKYEVFNIAEENIYFWDYNHFINVDKDGDNEIKLFNNDVYELEIITKMDKYLIMADYNDKYTFNRLYLINTENNKIINSELEYDIYFNSYILGYRKKKLYLYDLQIKKEYEIYLFKDETKRVEYKIWNKDKWENVPVSKLNKKEALFDYGNTPVYKVVKDKLFYCVNNNDVLISSLKVDRFIDVYENDAYFVSGDSLYRANLYEGVTKLITYDEWNYNNKNIYIFK